MAKLPAPAEPRIARLDGSVRCPKSDGSSVKIDQNDCAPAVAGQIATAAASTSVRTMTIMVRLIDAGSDREGRTFGLWWQFWNRGDSHDPAQFLAFHDLPVEQPPRHVLEHLATFRQDLARLGVRVGHDPLDLRVDQPRGVFGVGATLRPHRDVEELAPFRAIVVDGPERIAH